MGTRLFLIENARWLVSGALLAFLSSFGQTFFISLFAGEIRATFELSHGAWGGIYSLGTATSAIVMFWAGGLTDRFRARVLGSYVLVLLALACVLISISTLWLLPIAIFLLRLAGQGMTMHISTVAMARWFGASRGKALSIAQLGFAFGEAFLPMVFVAFMALWDWRLLWLFSASIALSGIPLLLILLRRERQPQKLAEDEQSVGMKARHWTRAQALRHPLFWFMVPGLLGPSAFNTAFFFQQVHVAEVKGWTHLDLVALFPLYTAVGVAAMLASGWLLDRLGTARLIPFYQIPIVVAFAVFAFADTLGLAVIGFVFLGMTTGANSTLPNAFWAEFYGTANLGSIKAMAAAVMVLGSALGPGLTGLLIDAGIGIETQFLGISAYFVFSSLVMLVGITRSGRAATAAV